LTASVTRSRSILSAEALSFALTSDFSYRDNHLLATLSDDDFDLLRPHLAPVDLITATPVFRAGEPASHVWFPHLGVISIVAGDADGGTVEVATVGREGMTGVSLVLGSETMTNDAMVQVAGHGCRMEAAAFYTAVEASPSLRRVMLRYVLAVITQISQNAACNQLHAINSRCARWLLTTHDRVAGDSFGLTQEFLAMMLGVTRPSVSTAAAALKAAGLVNYSRGVVSILDRKGLEAASCECYRIIENEFDRLRRAS
jgi:CRP-like cAMP-binding protein